MDLTPPTAGLIAMRIGQEFGPPEEFASSLERALARGGERGATMVAILVIARLCEPSSELHIAEDWYRRTALADLLGV